MATDRNTISLLSTTNKMAIPGCQKRNSNTKALGNWVNEQRQNYREGKLSDARWEKLEAIGFHAAEHEMQWIDLVLHLLLSLLDPTISLTTRRQDLSQNHIHKLQNMKSYG
jgi:hypothetical protein